MAELVTIASKLQLGLVLELETPYVVMQELHGGGVREETRYVKATDRRVVINGCAVPRGEPHDKEIVCGFALTHGVDKAFWEEWKRQKKGFPPLEKGEIFAYEKMASVQGEAKEKADMVTGAEPADPENLPKEFTARNRKIKAA